MCKKNLIFFSLFSTLVNASTQSNIPIALSLNIGMPPMTGCQSIKANPQIDCSIHRLGVAPVVNGTPQVLGLSRGAHTVQDYQTNFSNEVCYTQFHVNGYFASTASNYSFVRFGTHTPFASVNGISQSGYACQNYAYTVVEYIIFCQNIIADMNFLPDFTKASKALSAKKPLNYSSCNLAINTALATYLMSNRFFKYSCSSGNLLGGKYPLSHTKAGGMTAFQNYLFDGCCVYNGSVFLCNNFDVSPALRVDPIMALANALASQPTNSALNQSAQINVTSFTNNISKTVVALSDYFNGLSNGAVVYIPLHMADPGTTYIGTDFTITHP